MTVVLTLGGVVFSDFEIPESINSGGEQTLIVHKLPGGGRVIDAMGPDDADIRWSGRFRAASAEERALLLDLMRRQGNQVLLTYSLHRYQVLIREFTANFQYGGNEIPYSIACTVLLDETQAITSAAIGFLEAMAGDVVAALGLSDVIGNATISAAVTGVGTALSNYQAGVPNTTNLIAGATSVTEAPLIANLQNSIATAQTATQTAITATPVNTAPLAVSSPTAMATALTATASGFSSLSTLYQLSSTLSRLGTNAANTGT